MPKGTKINALTQTSWQTMREAGGIKQELTGPAVGKKVLAYITAKTALYNFLKQNTKQIRATYSTNNKNLAQDLDTLKPGYKLIKELCTKLEELVNGLRKMKERTAGEIAKFRGAAPQYLKDFDTNIADMIREGDDKLKKWQQARDAWKSAKANLAVDAMHKIGGI
jgi:hypothetical protein